jgi:2-polyprenyl-3-methyl-5-hydroxy-6-metoxy-1,4-benzoquinol methylase
MSMIPEATPEDVAAAYRLFLGREPESRDVVETHLAAKPSVWDIVIRIYHSGEAERRRADAACGFISKHNDASKIETEAAPGDLTELTEHIRGVWARYGREEVYYSVLTNPQFLRERLSVADLEAFYESGVGEMRTFEEICRRNLITPDPKGSILELGCGVGRVGEAFARRYSSYTGVDISAGHLAIARQRFASGGLSNAELSTLEAFLASSETYDVFFSVLVLQHNPPPIIRDLLDECLARVRPGGLAYFQVPCQLYDYSFSVERYLAGEGRQEHMEIHAIPQRNVFALLSRHGLIPAEVTPNNRVGPIGLSYTFLASKQS